MAPTAPSDESLSLTKACNPCRLLKTRCVIETESGQKRCQRCIKIGKDCTFPTVQKRRPRKRTTDVRVADLENQIRSMKGLLGQDQTNENGLQREQSDQTSIASSMNATSGVVLNDTVEGGSQHSPYEQLSEKFDIADPGLISDALAEELYHTYGFDLAEHYPLVTFPDDYSIQNLRNEKPILFLAVMAAAARKSHPQLSKSLNSQVLQSYAIRVFMNSEKSLELVQAMIITVVWYSPPNGFGSGQHKFYEYIHMAATMALDLGLGSKSSQAEGTASAASDFSSSQRSLTSNAEPVGTENAQPSPASQKPEFCEADDEIMRTRLSCFVLCCGVALSMRRPNMLKYNDWVAGGVKHFQRSMSAKLSDQRLLAWVQLLKIADEISTDLSFVDVEHIAKITDLNLPISLHNFEKRLRQWRADLAPGIMNGSLELSYHYFGIYLHEIALHDAHSPEDFVPPFSFEKIRSYSKSPDPKLPHLGATLHCITSAHALIETFVHMDVESLRTLPIVFYIRLSYALFILEIITAPLISKHALCDPYSYMTHDSIQVDFYLTLSIKHLERVVAPVNCVIPSMFLDMFLNLQEWHEQNAASPNVWPGGETQSRMPPVGMSAAASDSSSSAQLGWMEDGSLNSAGTFNNGIILDDNLQRSQAMIPNAGWTSSAHSVPTPSQPAAPYPILQSTNPTFSTLPDKWSEQATQIGPPSGIDSNFDLSGDFDMDFDPSNLFVFNDTMDSMHTGNN